MESQLGWALLSCDASRQAEAPLRDELEAIWDEIGFLALHQSFAALCLSDTSVIQTRFCHRLFVPWMYEKIARHHPRQRVTDALPEEALDLTPRLQHPMRGPESRNHE
jgi:hypothetical protein